MQNVNLSIALYTALWQNLAVMALALCDTHPSYDKCSSALLVIISNVNLSVALHSALCGSILTVIDLTLCNTLS